MRTVSAGIAALLLFSAPALAENVPDTPLVTGPGFQQIPAPLVVITPVGGSQTTLGAALAAGCPKTGCTFTGPLHMGSNLIDGSNIGFTGGTLNGVTIGATTPGTGTFTTLGASGAVSLTGAVSLGSTIGTNVTNGAQVFLGNGSGGWNFQTGGGGLALVVNGSSSSLSNRVTISGAASGSGPQINATGPDTNIQLKLFGKGGFAASGAGAVLINLSPLDVTPGTQTVTADVVPGFSFQSALTGTATGNPSLQYDVADWQIVSDSLALPGANQFLDGYQFSYNFGSSTSMTGNRNAFVVNLVQKGTTGNTIASGMTGFYVAGLFRATASFNDNGTGLTSSTAHGRLIGLNPSVGCNSGATNFYQCGGIEVNASISTGASALVRDFIAIASTSGAVQGTNVDAGIWFYSSAGALLKDGILFGTGGGLNAWPIDSSGTIIATDSGTAATGIDFSATTFSTAFLKSTGFTVDGSGNVTGASYKAGATAGVTCSGTPTASFASTSGIVTHC